MVYSSKRHKVTQYYILTLFINEQSKCLSCQLHVNGHKINCTVCIPRNQQLDLHLQLTTVFFSQGNSPQDTPSNIEKLDGNEARLETCRTNVQNRSTIILQSKLPFFLLDIYYVSNAESKGKLNGILQNTLGHTPVLL